MIVGSIADRDGRIRKGDRILSINGKILKGVTHREALDIMKAPRPEVVIVLSRMSSQGSDASNINGHHSRNNSSDQTEDSNRDQVINSVVEENISELQSSSSRDFEDSNIHNYRVLVAELTKDVAGLGFILEGGKDSPLGDKPLAIKRIFRGLFTLIY